MLVDVSGCLSNPCYNGATCYPGIAAGYVCVCPLGFVGPTCNRGESLISLMLIETVHVIVNS